MQKSNKHDYNTHDANAYNIGTYPYIENSVKTHSNAKYGFLCINRQQKKATTHKWIL